MFFTLGSDGKFKAMSNGLAMKYMKMKSMEPMEEEDDEMEDEVEQEELYMKDPKTGEFVKVAQDTTIKKTSASFKRAIGDTAAQMKKAEEIGLKGQSDLLKKRMEEKKKALMEAKKQL